MSQNPDSAASFLLCRENTNACFYDFDCNDEDAFGISHPGQQRNNQNSNQDSIFNNIRSKSLMGFTVQSEERVKEMVEREREHLPRDNYLMRLRSGDLDLSARREALDWILKAQVHHSFGPVSVCLAVNYLDRFLSHYDLHKDKAWAVQLLALACLSLAAKMVEIRVPFLQDLQVGEPKFVFETKTLRRMELLVLSTLKWRMQALTPCSFIDYFLSKINDQHLYTHSISRSLQVILNAIKGIDLLEFRPSEIAAAVAICVSREVQAIDIDHAIPCFYVEKGRVLKCIELMKDLSLSSGCTSASASSVPQSPNRVLDAACLSNKSDDITVGSCTNSSHSSQDSKKRKIDNNKPCQVEHRRE